MKKKSRILSSIKRNYKPKKLKANAVLTVFVISFSLFLLSAFGIDGAYVILSRYKLQKITEAIAFEYAAALASDVDGSGASEEDRDSYCEDIKTRYKSIYNLQASGVTVFEISNMEYKMDTTNDEAAVRVYTTSAVLPAFLRFAGVKRIVIYARACAKTQKISISKTISMADSSFDLSEGYYADKNSAYAQFDTPFEDDDKYSDVISAKYTGKGDFAIDFAYDTTTNSNSGGGFFVLGGYESNGTIRWIDLADKLKSSQDIKQICEEGTCLYCINGAENSKAVFDLELDSTTNGETRRLTNIRVYKAAGSAALLEDGSGYNDPCETPYTDESGDVPNYSYFNRDAAVTLNILNNVSIIKSSEYDNFGSGELTTGTCAGG
ncbi:MAG: hypothetical protein LUE64_00405 [Candidatus Gastranaerophilales bacterium]|nr:hypothetical protein [Candidatus Gastranaerophilales bacterium]